jgi:hypothetical protein
MASGKRSGNGRIFFVLEESMDEPKKRGITVVSTEAPFIYTDGVATFGANGGMIQLELGANVIVPTADGGTKIEVVMVAHIRCNLGAAIGLRDSLNKAIEMAQNPAVAPSAAAAEGRLN